MASPFTALLILTISMTTTLAASKEYIVGDDEGWRVPDKTNSDMYSKWAGKFAFRAGDSLVFKYQNDTVMRVDKTGYYHCNETDPGRKFDGGSNVFVLDKPGFYYFASADLQHCKKGQRLMLEVQDHNGPPASPVSSLAVSSLMPCSVALVAVVSVTALAWMT